MCAGCGTPPPNGDWYGAGLDDGPGARLRALARLATAADHLFGPAGVRSSAHPGSGTITLRTAVGRQATVQSFPELCVQVAALLGAPFDPISSAQEAQENA